MGNGCSCCKESDNVNESQGGNGEGEREPLLRSGGGGDAARVVASGQAVVTQPPKRGPQDDKDVSLPATPDTHPDVYAKVEILPSGTPNVDRKLQDMASHFGEYVDQVNELVLLHDRLRGSFPDVCPNSDLQEAMRHLAQQLGSHVSVNKSRSESIGDDTYHIATETGNNDQPPPQWDEDVQCALQDLNKALELGVRLTSNGERLIQTCESLVARETELRKEVMVAQSGVDGPLRNQAFVRSMKNLKAVPNKVRALRQVVANTFRELKDVTDFFGTDPLGTDRVLIDLSSNTPPTVYREAVEPEIPPEAQDTAAQMVVASWLQDRDKTPASTKPPPSEYLYQNGQYRPVATPVDDLDVSALLIRRDDTPPVPGMLSGDLPQVHVATETAPELAASTTQDVQVAEERLVQAADPGVTEQNFQEQMSADDDVMKYIVKQEEETAPVQEQRLEQPEDEQEQQPSEDGEPHAVEEEEEEAVVVEVVATSSTSLAEDGQKSEEDKEERENLEEDRSLEEQEQNVDDAIEQEVEQEVEGTSGDEKIVESQDAEQVESEGENDQQAEAKEQAEKSVADDEQKVAAESQEEVSEETLEEQVETQEAENENDQDKEEDDGDEAEETLQDSQATLEQSGEDDLNTAAGDSEAIEHQTHGDDEQQKEEEHQSNGGQQQQQQQKGNDEHRSDGDAKQQNGDHVREESDEEDDTKSKEDDMAYQTADSSGVSEETLDSSSPQHAGARAGGDSQSPGTADEDQMDQSYEKHQELKKARKTSMNNNIESSPNALNGTPV